MIDFVLESQIERSRFRSLMSLCKRAGQLVSGETQSESAIKSKSAKIVFLSCDASKNTVKKFGNKSLYYNTPIIRLEFTKEQLGEMIGDTQRSVIAVTGGDFAEQFINFYKRTDEET